MKNIFKYLSLAAISALAMTACSEDGPDYAGPGATSDAPGVVFSASAASSYTLTPSETVLNIPVTRTSTAAAGSYAVTVVKNQDNALVVPAQVSFAAGAKEAVLPVGFTADFAIGETKELQLSLSEDLKSPYTKGNSVLVTKVTRDYIWNDLGVATMQEGFLGVTLKTHLYQRSDDASYYRIDFPYTRDAYVASGTSDMIGGLSQDYIEFTVKNGVVSWGKWYTGLTYDGSDEQSIIAFQPSALSSKLNDNNTVVNFNEDGSISYIVFSPYYYIPGVGGWGENECDLYWPDYVFPEEPEEEEESAQDFAYGMALEDYLGSYVMTYGKSEYEVTISDNGNGTVTIGPFADGVNIVASYFGGLLYIASQPIVIPGYEKFNFGLYMADAEDNLYADVYLYAGFNEAGELKIKSYPYNVTTDEDGNFVAAPKMVGFYIIDLKEGVWDFVSDAVLVKASENKSASLSKVMPKARKMNAVANFVAKAPTKMIR